MPERIVISSDLHEAKRAERKLLAEIQRLGYDEGNRFAIRLALEEALNNAIRHGNGCDPKRTVEVSYCVSDRQTEITVTDQGCGFDPQAVPDPTAEENLEKPCGRGIMLMRAYMDEVRFNAKGNEVYMCKRKS